MAEKRWKNDPRLHLGLGVGEEASQDFSRCRKEGRKGRSKQSDTCRLLGHVRQPAEVNSAHPIEDRRSLKGYGGLEGPCFIARGEVQVPRAA